MKNNSKAKMFLILFYVITIIGIMYVADFDGHLVFLAVLILGWGFMMIDLWRVLTDDY